MKFDTSKKIPPQEITELMEALWSSPSSFGLQPWKFIIVHDTALRKALRHHAHGQSQVTDADTLIVFCSLKSMDEAYVRHYIDHMAQIRGVERVSLSGYEQTILSFLRARSPEVVSQWMKNQVYIALGVLLTECDYRKIDACPIEGFDPKKFDEILGLPQQGLESVVLCTIGYRAKDDKYAQLKKVRFDKNEIFIERA